MSKEGEEQAASDEGEALVEAEGEASQARDGGGGEFERETKDERRGVWR